MTNKVIKPPLGILPKELFLEFLEHDIKINGGMSEKHIFKARFDNLKLAIQRYLNVNKTIPIEWIEEYNELSPPSNEIEFKL